MKAAKTGLLPAGWMWLALCAAPLAGCSRPAAQHKAAGNILFNARDLDGALAEYRAAAKLAPKDPDPRVLAGNTLFEKADYDGAEREYRDALALRPDDTPALRGLSEVALRRAPPDFRGALADLLDVVRIEPKDHDAWAALGQLQLQTGDLKGAEASLMSALRISQDAGSLYALGLVLIGEGDTKAALNTFDRLEEVAPGKPQAPYGRAQAEARAGSKDAALADLRAALERGVPDLDAVRNDQNLAGLRDDPRFAALLASAGKGGR